MRTAAPSAAQMSIFVTAPPVIPRRPWPFEANGMLEKPWRGKSSIKRDAIAPGSADAHRSPGNRAINAANLCVAVSFGSSDNLAASCHGSRFSRVSAERTLSGISSLSAPIGAYRKASNSDLKKETETAGVTMTTNHIGRQNNTCAPLPSFISGLSVRTGRLAAASSEPASSTVEAAATKKD